MHLLRTLFFFEAVSHGGQSHICMGPIIDWLMPYRVSSSPLSYHTPNTIHPQDLSSCCLAFLSFLLCISYFNPLSSNPTYLMPVCIIPQLTRSLPRYKQSLSVSPQALSCLDGPAITRPRLDAKIASSTGGCG